MMNRNGRLLAALATGLLMSWISNAATVFQDNFDGTNLQELYWTANQNRFSSSVNPGAFAVTGGVVNFGCQSNADTKGKYEFSGNQIIIEGRFAGTGTARDTLFYLIDATNPNNFIQVGDTNYEGAGFYTAGAGTWALQQLGNGNSVGSYKEYRLTIAGTDLKWERGESLSNITETLTRTLPSTINGKSFYLSIGTAGPYYCPGSYDWVRITSDFVTNSSTSGLVAYYPFDGNANDLGSNVNNGTPSGSVGYVSGRFGQASVFNPSNVDTSGYVLANPALNTDTAFTVSAWVKPSYLDPSSANPATIVMERAFNGYDNCGAQSAGNYDLQIYQHKFAFATSTIDPSGICTYKRLFANAQPVLGDYQLVTGVYERSAGTAKIYINGVLDNQVLVGNALRTVSGAVLRISRNSNAANQPWHGEIDEVRIYNRALSAAEVQQLYTFGASPPVYSELVDTYGFYDSDHAGQNTFDFAARINTFRYLNNAGVAGQVEVFAPNASAQGAITARKIDTGVVVTPTTRVCGWNPPSEADALGKCATYDVLAMQSLDVTIEDRGEITEGSYPLLFNFRASSPIEADDAEWRTWAFKYAYWRNFDTAVSAIAVMGPVDDRRNGSSL